MIDFDHSIEYCFTKVQGGSSLKMCISLSNYNYTYIVLKTILFYSFFFRDQYRNLEKFVILLLNVKVLFLLYINKWKTNKSLYRNNRCEKKFCKNDKSILNCLSYYFLTSKTVAVEQEL